VRSSTRPKPPKHSTTVGLDSEDARKLLAAADASGLQENAIINLMVRQGPRVSEVADLPIGAYRWNNGVRTLVIFGKGGKRREVRCQQATADALDAWLAQRAADLGVTVAKLDRDEPMFVSRSGGRLTQQIVLRMLRRLAKQAGIPYWDQLSPHSTRHTFATLSREAGVPLDQIQYEMGHESITTTQRYDRAFGAIGRSGAAALEGFLASDASSTTEGEAE
jgi:integrase/recombinase XerD